MTAEGEIRIFKALYLNKEGLHVRDISRRAGLTLPAVVKHIKKGEANGTISCETKGRMKICRLNFNSRKLTPILHEVELSRFNELPRTVRSSLNEFMDELQEKPLIALIFGSFAEGRQAKNSDLDILLVYQRMDDDLMKKVESSANRIRGRTYANLQPVSVSFNEFQKEMLNLENEFMRDIRKSALVVHGMESFIDALRGFYP